MPPEAIILELVELYHCRPSELEEEDGFLGLTLLHMRQWRDKTFQWKSNPKALGTEDRIRLHELVNMGVEDALTKDMTGGEKEKSWTEEDPEGLIVTKPKA